MCKILALGERERQIEKRIVAVRDGLILQQLHDYFSWADLLVFRSVYQADIGSNKE